MTPNPTDYDDNADHSLPQAAPSPSQSTSPSAKKYTLRSSASFSPPPSSPPNSPLPRVPPYFPRNSGARHCSESHPAPPQSAPAVAHAHALRQAQSTVDLRDPLPFPATHRLTSSEPLPDQAPRSPSQRSLRSPAKPRPKAVRASNELRVYSISVSTPSRRAVFDVTYADSDS